MEIVEGAVDEYADAAIRYSDRPEALGSATSPKPLSKAWPRITVKPEWVGLTDFKTRYPSTHGANRKHAPSRVHRARGCDSTGNNTK